MDDTSKSTDMPEDMLMHFFKMLLAFGSIEFCSKHIKILDNIGNSNNNNTNCTAADFTGACSSADAASIACGKIS